LNLALENETMCKGINQMEILPASTLKHFENINEKSNWIVCSISAMVIHTTRLSAANFQVKELSEVYEK
jgi:hypothetical protein